jgi:2,4-dienoyl-CoA reductase-like NADH-dependent reductase (Old Yellow Enzyme family)
VSGPSLFNPIELPRSGGSLANRLVMAPMPTFAAHRDGSAGGEELTYYARRAPGLGAVITAGCAVSAEGLCFNGQWRCDSDRLIASLESVAGAIAAHSFPVLQLCHGGSFTDGLDYSAVIQDFEQGARRAGEAGFSAVEIHGGHRYLLHQYFSRRNPNPSVAERSRLSLAIVEACARRLPCWYRLDPEEPGPTGISFAETTELAQRLVESGVEVLDVSAKRYQQGSVIESERPRPLASLLAGVLLGRALVLGVGGIETPIQAETVLSDGCALVGLGSVLLANPDWPRDAREGRAMSDPSEKPSSDTLVSLAVPAPVIRYLAQRGRLSDAS